jgi:hypothetical protein
MILYSHSHDTNISEVNIRHSKPDLTKSWNRMTVHKWNTVCNSYHLASGVLQKYLDLHRNMTEL